MFRYQGAILREFLEHKLYKLDKLIALTKIIKILKF